MSSVAFVTALSLARGHGHRVLFQTCIVVVVVVVIPYYTPFGAYPM